MIISQHLDLRQSQSLVMTPQLQQAIKLLQMSNLELSDFIAQEIEQNPLLEIADSNTAPVDDKITADGGDETPPDGATPDNAPLDRAQADSATLAESQTTAAPDESPLDTDYANVWADEDSPLGSSWEGRKNPHDFQDDDGDSLQLLTRNVTLREHLAEQLAVEIHDPADRLIGAMLLENLDDAGYLAIDLDDVAKALACPPAQVARVLARVQRFDPVGIGARSLSECLALQLQEKNRLDPAMQALLDHLDLMAARNIPALLRVCGVDMMDLQDMMAEIRALDPRPAQAFQAETAPTVVPDILMRALPDGTWRLELNPDTLPAVLVNQSYYARVTAGARSKQEKDYLTDCLQSANWLVKALHQRAETVLRVASEIVRRQNTFFLYGVSHLKPLILRDIANAIEMHESTVSRVTSNKYISTPRGLFELKYFFTTAIAGVNGQETLSAEAVRYRLKALIDAEPPTAILSDDQLVNILQQEGIDIARRTVAKYREAMKIPSSVQRRREKAAAV